MVLSFDKKMIKNERSDTFDERVVMKSLSLQLKSNKKEVVNTDSLHFGFKHSLSSIRGQSFFTSALVLSNSEERFLWGFEYHYQRFLKCYQDLFERSDFPLSKAEMKALVDEAIALNPTESRMHCLIVFTGGEPRVYSDDSGSYGSGFGGELSHIHIVLKEYAYKPNWSYESGVNVITMPFQRPVASAKPTNYLGGIVGQHRIDALNRFSCIAAYRSGKAIKDLKKEALQLYNSLSVTDQATFRLLLNDSRAIAFDQLFQKAVLTASPYACSSSFLTSYDWLAISSIHKEDCDLYEQKFYHQCFHEVLFTSDDETPFVLEGSTFSLMAIDKQDQLLFIPLEGNSANASDDNAGKVLESTTVQLLQDAAKEAGLSFQVSPITCDTLFQCKAVYPVSSTRIRIADDGVSLQPLASINARPLLHEDTAVYRALMTAVHETISAYQLSSI